jgi:DNA end-binding protein Ku
VVLTNREHIIALRARDKGLVGSLLRYPTECETPSIISATSSTTTDCTTEFTRMAKLVNERLFRDDRNKTGRNGDSKAILRALASSPQEHRT